jgi:hypothetical protein
LLQRQIRQHAGPCGSCCALQLGCCISTHAATVHATSTAVSKWLLEVRGLCWQVGCCCHQLCSNGSICCYTLKALLCWEVLLLHVLLLLWLLLLPLQLLRQLLFLLVCAWG